MRRPTWQGNTRWPWTRRDMSAAPTVTVTRDHLTAALAAILDDGRSNSSAFALLGDTYSFGSHYYVKPETLAIVLIGRLRAAGCADPESPQQPARLRRWLWRRLGRPASRPGGFL